MIIRLSDFYFMPEVSMPWAFFVLTHLSIDAHAIINSEGVYPSGITISYLDIFVQEALISFLVGAFFI